MCFELGMRSDSINLQILDTTPILQLESFESVRRTTDADQSKMDIGNLLQESVKHYVLSYYW